MEDDDCKKMKRVRKDQRKKTVRKRTEEENFKEKTGGRRLQKNEVSKSF